MPVRTKRLFGPTSLTNVAKTLFTVPVGYTAIIKSIVVVNETATGGTFKFGVGGVAAAQVLQSNQQGPANNTNVSALNNWVLGSGESLVGIFSAAVTVYIHAHGTLLQGVAP